MLENTSEKIKNKTLTIREAFDIAGKDLTTPKGQPTSVAKAIEAAGKSLDSPWFDIGSGDSGVEFLKKLNEVGTESSFVTLTTVETKVAGQATINDLAPPPNIFSAGGKARKLNLEKASQARRTRKFKAVPSAKTAVPALVEGLDVITDPETRAAVAFNLLVPLRPGEVADIKIDDIDFETGKFKDSWQRGKKIRNDIDLPEVPMAILEDAKKRAEAAGRTTLFDTNTGKMTKAVNASGGIKDKFAPFASAMGRELRGVSDLRKIIPSLMAGELKLGVEVSTIMGHSSYDEMIGSMKAMTANSYVSGLISEEGSASKQSLKAFHNLFANTLGLQTINELPATLGVDASSLTSEGSPRIAVIKPGDDVSKAVPSGPITDDDLGLIEETREERRARLQLSKLETQEKALEVEARVLEKEKDISAKREAVKKQTEQDRESRRQARIAERENLKAAEDARKAQEELEKMYDDPKKVMNADIEDTKKKFGTFFSDMAKKFRLVPVAGTALTAAAIGERAEAGDTEGAIMEGLYGFTPLGMLEPERPASGEIQPDEGSFMEGYDATQLPGREDVLGKAEGGPINIIPEFPQRQPKARPPFEMEQLGDVEYRADLDPALARNPLARLGYATEIFELLPEREQGEIQGFYKYQRKEGEPGFVQEKMQVTPKASGDPDIQGHEFTHRAIQLMFDKAFGGSAEDVQKFEQMYGMEAAGLLNNIARVSGSRSPNEFMVELFDPEEGFYTDLPNKKVDKAYKKGIGNLIRFANDILAESGEPQAKKDRRKLIEMNPEDIFDEYTFNTREYNLIDRTLQKVDRFIQGR